MIDPRLHTLADRLPRWLLPLGLLLAAVGLAPAQEKVELNPTEFKVALLAKIPAYVTWPDAGNAVVLGILGKDPFGGLLQQLLKNKKVDGRELVVKVLDPQGPPAKCDILYVPGDQLPSWEELRKNLDPHGLLTIGERSEFLNKGGVLNLSVEDRRLEINLHNAKKAGLEISSKLVKLSRVVAR